MANVDDITCCDVVQDSFSNLVSFNLV